jgi:hypothetical protein
VALLILAITGITALFAPDKAGLVGGCAWGLLLIVQSLVARNTLAAATTLCASRTVSPSLALVSSD